MLNHFHASDYISIYIIRLKQSIVFSNPNVLTSPSFPQLQPMPSAHNFMLSPFPVAVESPTLWQQEKWNSPSSTIWTRPSTIRAQPCNHQVSGHIPLPWKLASYMLPSCSCILLQQSAIYFSPLHSLISANQWVTNLYHTYHTQDTNIKYETRKSKIYLGW